MHAAPQKQLGIDICRRTHQASRRQWPLPSPVSGQAMSTASASPVVPALPLPVFAASSGGSRASGAPGGIASITSAVMSSRGLRVPFAMAICGSWGVTLARTACFCACGGIASISSAAMSSRGFRVPWQFAPWQFVWVRGNNG